MTINNVWQGELVWLREVEAEEGHLRRMVYTEGVYHDEISFGMTREEFEANENFNRG